jgi:hypothetical protein
VRYVDLYPGLDLEISSDNGQMVQRLVIKDSVVTGQAAADGQPPATDVSAVKWQVEGADALALDGAGSLQLFTALGEVSLPLLQPIAADGTFLSLPVTPEINGLEVAAPLAATPQTFAASSQAGLAATGDLASSTFIGGSYYFDSSEDIAIDAAGYAYITGRAYFTFPTTPGVFDPTIEGFFNDAFIAKLTPDGSSLVYATFLGGNTYAQSGYAIAIDGAGNAYVTGYTVSGDFPATPGAFDTSLSGGGDAFIAKINSTSTALLYATFLGGNADDYGYDIALDGAGQAYLTGDTRSTDFPTTPGALAPGYKGGFSDGFALKLSADGSSMIYSTLLCAHYQLR